MRRSVTNMNTYMDNEVGVDQSMYDKKKEYLKIQELGDGDFFGKDTNILLERFVYELPFFIRRQWLQHKLR